MVKASSDRLECLKRNPTCVRCKRSGSVWMLQVSKQMAPRVAANCFIEKCPWCALKKKIPRTGTETPHLNLYHVNRKGGLLLMTQDHIFPQHAGGSNSVENLQTMCSECNSYKGGMLPSEYEKVMLPHERFGHPGRVDGRGIAEGRLPSLYPLTVHEEATVDCAAE